MTKLKKDIQINRIILIINQKFKILHWYMYWLSCDYCRVATLCRLYLTVTGIIMTSLQLIGQFQHA